MHRASQRHRRGRIETATAQHYMSFLFEWQHLAPGSQLVGVTGLTTVIAQLQGWHAAAAAWEPSILRSRLSDYRGEVLDQRCLAGDITWARLISTGDAAKPTTTKSTPITLGLRGDLGWLSASLKSSELGELDPEGPAQRIHQHLLSAGARFHHELVDSTQLTPAEVEAGLWDLVWRGAVHADSFHAVRSLFAARDRNTEPRRVGRGLRRGSTARSGGEGRWTLLPPSLDAERDELAEAVAEQLLARWGVVFHALVARESLAVPWREVLWALRRLEARGLILGGRFVAGFSGEQYASPEAAAHLDRVRSLPRTGVTVSVNACDPANLTGVITPGDRIAARRATTILYVDGIPQETAS